MLDWTADPNAWIALATLTPEQLAALRPPKRKRPDEPESSEPESKPAGHTVAHQETKPEGALRRLTRRPRARQRG